MSKPKDWHESRRRVSRARYEVALVLRQRDFTYEEIGTFFGVTLERARQIVFKGERHRGEWHRRRALCASFKKGSRYNV